MEELNETYKYKGLPLKANSLADAILKLYGGKLAETQTILQEAIKYHKNNGGVDSDASSISYLISRAMTQLKSRGISISNPSTGWWRIGEENGTEEVTIIQTETETIAILEETSEEVSKTIADYILGTGNSAVYVYYLPLYRQYAEQKSEVFFPCKIGRTDRDPLQRILSQASTALPERPHVAIIIKTNYPVELENAFHNVLSLRGRRIDDSPGTEWFLTSPNEIISIYDFIIPKNDAQENKNDTDILN